MQNKRTERLKNNQRRGILQAHIMNNLRNYVILTIIFLIGVVLGVLFINNVNQSQTEEISIYITEFIEKLKGNANIDYIKLLISSIKQNLLIALLLWFAGLTVFGIFVVYGIICFRGFCLGYSISSIIATLGTRSRKHIYFFKFTYAKYNIYTNNSCASKQSE